MLNPITRAVAEIHFRVPKEILNEVFKPLNYNWRLTVINIDEQIINQVIKPRVMVDCDLVGGTEVLVPLIGVPSHSENNYTTIFHIPKSMTQGRSITSVLSYSYMSAALASVLNNNMNMPDCGRSALVLTGQAMFDSFNLATMPSSARVDLIAENTIMVKDTNNTSGTGVLRCVVSNDENFSNLQIRSIPYFVKLCELAVKSYIFNKYAIYMDEGTVKGGYQIGRFKEIIDGYADSEQMYQEYLMTTWKRTAFMNDTETHTRYLRALIGGRR